MIKCPTCTSSFYRKNGKVKGRQRYLCKNCGRQFLEVSSAVSLSAHDLPVSEPITEIVNIVHKQTNPNAIANDHEVVKQQAILLLDAENIKLDHTIEKFLGTFINFPLSIKIAFADWKNLSLGKQDIELQDRGYQLIHTPGGKNSADGKMIAVGSSIFLHYPQVKEIFICSNDGIFTHLCTELQNRGLIVYWVKRKNNHLSIHNLITREVKTYSLELEKEIPSWEDFALELEHILKKEYESISDRVAQLSILGNLFQQKYELSLGKNEHNNIIISGDNPDDKKINDPSFDPENMDLSVNEITSQEDLENVITHIINFLRSNFPKDAITVSRLSSEVRRVCGQTLTSLVKTLNLSSNSTKFLQSNSKFILTKRKSHTEVMLVQEKKLKANSTQEVKQFILKIMQEATQKNKKISIPLEMLGTKFNQEYGESISTTLKKLKVNDNFVVFIESCKELNLKKVGNSYLVSLNNN